MISSVWMQVQYIHTHTQQGIKSITLGHRKPPYLSPIHGNGIFRSNGHFWVNQRKIIVAMLLIFSYLTFYLQKLPITWYMLLIYLLTYFVLIGWGMVGLIILFWFDDDLRAVSAYVIPRACFGSSYTKGKEIFSKLRALQKTISSKGMHFGIPTYG